MPNNITNIIAINHVSKERLDEIMSAIRSDEENILRNSIDFGKLIPMPPELQIESSSRSERALKLYRDFLLESGALGMSDEEISAAGFETLSGYFNGYIEDEGPGMLMK